MKFTAATALAAAAGLASAAPTPATTATGNVAAFNLMSVRSASPIQFGTISASQENLFIGLPSSAQDAKCDATLEGNRAVFTLRDGALFLYNKDTESEQQIWVDRSGMGQGNLGYLTSNDENPPRNAELTGWTSTPNGDYSFLDFKGAGLLACPANPEGSWSIWVNAGTDKPAGIEGCLGFSAMVQPIDDPVSCVYS